jgi:hypothetical protein
MSEQQVTKIKSVLRIPHLYLFLLVVVIFTIINTYFNELYIVGLSIFRINPFISIPYITLIAMNTIFVGITFTLAYVRFKEVGIITPHVTITSFFGSFFALVTGACPGCVSGLLPVVAGIFGSSLNLNSFPLYGLEIQILSSLLLLFGVYQLSKEVVCKL